MCVVHAQVLTLVQKQMKGRAPVTHASLTRGAKRRTAAGAFFELLQVCLSVCDLKGFLASFSGVSSQERED